MAMMKRTWDVGCQSAGMMDSFDEGPEPDVPVEQFGFCFQKLRKNGIDEPTARY
jgi:hypothetical protein